jgi:S1-C subfamily serine protease
VIVGDIIVGVESYKVRNTDDLLNALEQFKPGNVVSVQTIRHNQPRTVQVRLSEPR